MTTKKIIMMTVVFAVRFAMAMTSQDAFAFAPGEPTEKITSIGDNGAFKKKYEDG